ncbi:MAG: PH domain-containing protein [Phycisphaerales bacterium]|nr:PH domain-containing protein [Phycisphaerales bacterium]NNM27162.1 PH domain-containing protein [Phycisphaerales bacterium]
MIEVSCDNCERPIEVPDDQAGSKVRCPACGDVNRIPEAVVREVAAIPASAPVVAAVAAVPETGPVEEKEIVVVRPAMFRAHPLKYVLLVLAFIAGIVIAVGAKQSVKIGDWMLWVGVAVSVIALVWFIKWWIATHWWIRVSITNKRTVRHEGIIRRHSTEVLHDHVRSVDINQNFLQRIFRVGYIGIDSAGQDGIEIEIRDIPGPFEIKKVIDRYRKM